MQQCTCRTPCRAELPADMACAERADHVPRGQHTALGRLEAAHGCPDEVHHRLHVPRNGENTLGDLRRNGLRQGQGDWGADAVGMTAILRNAREALAGRTEGWVAALASAASVLKVE